MLGIDKLSMEMVIVQSPGNIVSDMDGETVMMNIGNGKYYNLGIVGGSIWRHLSTPISINKLISELTNEFDVDRRECQGEVIPFLEQLISEKLIKIEKD